MARNLKKFCNPKFIRTANLDLLRRLLDRHRSSITAFDFGAFDGDESALRKTLEDFLTGPEIHVSESLVSDLHRIAELGTEAGLELIIEQAKRQNVILAPDVEGQAECLQDPKQVALRVFLTLPAVFESANDMLAYRSVRSCAEFAGATEGVDVDFGETSIKAFEEAIKPIFTEALRGQYCHVETYEDGEDIAIVIRHGLPFKSTEVVEENKPRLISFREIGHAVLRYSPIAGRLQMADVPAAQRQAIADAFGTTLLGQLGFFSAPDAQDLYTLESVEQDDNFRFRHEFDPGIVRVCIVEAQVNRMGPGPKGLGTRPFWSITVRDRYSDALDRLFDANDDISFQTGEWKLNHLVIRVEFNTGRFRPATVTVRMKPPGAPSFKRERFEARVMELLRRNGIARDRERFEPAAAAE